MAIESMRNVPLEKATPKHANLTEGEKQASTHPFDMPKETGFEQVTPTDFTEGDTSRAAIRSIIGPSDKEMNESLVARIRPVRDDQAASPDVKRFRCAACGKLVEVTKDGKKFPPCPICGEQGEWTLVEPKK